MAINDKVKKVIAESAFLVLVTVNPDGSPHPIVAGRGETEGDDVVFGIHKMERTQENILVNSSAQVLGAITAKDNPSGFRLSGHAAVREGAAGKQLVFTSVSVDTLI
jgi:predicted pyridoxine 5'-phosphate oxidase superfamily flavin-nucleotide-binding protein